MAYSAVTRLLNQAFDNAINSLKDIQKFNTQLLEQQQQNDKKTTVKQTMQPNDSTNAKKGGDSKGKSNKIEELPQSIEKWSIFELNPEIIIAWSHELMKKTGINQHTISEAYLLFYYLDELGEMLIKQGHSHLLFQIYALQLVLANNVIKFPNVNNVSLNIYVRMKYINLCVQLNLINSINFHQQALGSYILSMSKSADQASDQNSSVILSSILSNPSIFLKFVQLDAYEVCAVREHIYSFKKRMAQMQEEEANRQNMSVKSSLTSTSSFSGLLKKRQIQSRLDQAKKSQPTVKINDRQSTANKSSLNQMNDELLNDIKFPGEKPRVHDHISDMLYKDIWLKVAEELINSGFFHAARDYLYESLNACVVN